MSTETVQKRKIAVVKTRSSKSDTLKVPSFPQVNLLPSGIVEGRALKRVKGTADLGAVASLAVVGLLYGASAIDATNAETELAEARARTNELMAEQAKYSEVTIIRTERETFARAERQGMSTEVDWSTYVAAVAGVVPEAVTLASLEASVNSVLGRYDADADPLQGDPLGRITFGGTAETLPDTAAWVRALDALPGLAGARISVATNTEPKAGESLFTINGSVTITEDALSQRLFGTKE